MSKMGLGKEFCLWLVHPGDRKVRKVRFTRRMAAIGGASGLCLLASLAFITGDYARVQAERLKSHFFLKKVTEERDRLRNKNFALESKIRTLHAAEAAVPVNPPEEPAQSGRAEQGAPAPQSAAEQNRLDESVRKKLAELAEVIESATSLDLFDASKKAELVDEDPEDGVGGPEEECTLDDSDCVPLFSDTEDSRASLNIDSLNEPQSADDTKELLEQLKRSISIVRSLPIGHPTGGRMSSGFGYRQSPFGRGIKMHRGLDFAHALGSRIYATGDATVAAVKRVEAYGLMIDLEHATGVTTRFAHLSRALVKAGQKVQRGDVIGLVGSSGRSTGPHLHYEVRVNGRARNPVKFVRLAEQLNRIL